MRPGPDWFTGGYAEASFRRHLTPFAGTPNYYALQIGTYCGDASVWLLDNVITEQGAWLVDVDTWLGSKEIDHAVIDFAEVESFYVHRMKEYLRVGWWKGTSDDYFAMLPSPFDFIYIDGAHNAEQVLRDAINADRFLKVGGMIAFDDYKWWNGVDGDRPALAIDAFLNCYEKRYDVLEKDLQVWVQRVR